MDISDEHDPTAQALRDLIDLEGGPIVPETLGRALRNEAFPQAMVNLHYLGERLNSVSARNGSGSVSVHVTRSPAMGASMRPVTAEHAAVLVPVGTLARLHVTHRLLLGYWSLERQVPEMLGSLDDRPFERRLPRALVPLLRDLQGEDDWWNALDALDASIELDARFANDVSELTYLALSLLLSHEFAHVGRRHADLRRRVRSRELSFAAGDIRPVAEADVALSRAMEDDADRIGAYVAVWTLMRQTEPNPDRRSIAFVRLGYALTALLALFDPQKLSLMHFGAESAYPHPTIRQALLLDHIAACATGLGVPAEDLDLWLNYGARKALDALDQLEYDVYTGRRFCEEGEEVDPVIHALRTSRVNVLRLAGDASNERALALRLNDLVNATYGEFILT